MSRRELQAKTFEIRDRATFIPAVGVLMEAHEARDRWLLRRAGYGPGTNLVLLTRLDGGGQAHYDPDNWGGRTWPAVHQYITNHWHELESGALIDARVALGEATEPCESEYSGEVVSCDTK